MTRSPERKGGSEKEMEMVEDDRQDGGQKADVLCSFFSLHFVMLQPEFKYYKVGNFDSFQLKFI